MIPFPTIVVSSSSKDLYFVYWHLASLLVLHILLVSIHHIQKLNTIRLPSAITYALERTVYMRFVNEFNYVWKIAFFQTNGTL